MANFGLTPDPQAFAEFEHYWPGEPTNREAALGITYIRWLWPGGEAEALAHINRVFDHAMYEVVQSKLERAATDPTKTPAEIRDIARQMDELRAVRSSAA